MNIFYLHKDPEISAKMHCDKHVVKMIIEYAQLMSTAHRILDGDEYEGKTKIGRRIRRWKHPNKNIENTGLTLSEEDALKAQIFGCWSIPLGLPYSENLLVRIKLKLKPDGSVTKTEILDHARMNKPGQGFYKVLAESALRAVKLCQPLRVPTSGYERWKELQLNFDAREMLEG